ncbi:MAG: LytTR family transcriptional regulator DNA-binding domain-containing protein [Sphingomicrobium sp.]
MASAAPPTSLDRLRVRPLRGGRLAGVAAAVWLAGALYCSGYELLSSGFDNWPRSLLWAAAAVMPWFVLFEWSKSQSGRRATRSLLNLALIIVATAAISLAFEYAIDLAIGGHRTPLAMALLRRFPAMGVSLLLILWSRSAAIAAESRQDESLAAMAKSIGWIAAADNYVELHVGDGMILRRMTLRDAERALTGHGFVQIHRRYLVNRDQIASVTGNGDPMVRLKDGCKLPVGRAFASNLHRRG